MIIMFYFQITSKMYIERNDMCPFYSKISSTELQVQKVSFAIILEVYLLVQIESRVYQNYQKSYA